MATSLTAERASRDDTAPASCAAPEASLEAFSTIAGRRSSSKSPLSARRIPASMSPGSTVARKPISPKLTANTGTWVPE
jgi:hypothetical protein